MSNVKWFVGKNERGMCPIQNTRFVYDDCPMTLVKRLPLYRRALLHKTKRQPLIELEERRFKQIRFTQL